MKQHMLWLDLETAGLDWNQNSIIQLSCIVECEAENLDELDLFVKPYPGSFVNKAALKTNNVDIEDLRNDPKYIPYNEAFEEFIDFMSKYINRYDPDEKFLLAGKNIKQFDIEFLRQFFLHNDDPYYGSWFMYPHIDIETIVSELVLFDGLRLPDYKLETICTNFGVEIKEAHNSMCDIRSTRELYWKIKAMALE